ncbi:MULTISPECIES: hypothetical protein [unclassified Streptomyces]|uniref:hypothetical protein n=1 Tax=unclassified Streptomyces TaxID=2593676 RepID=UPI00380BB616
MPAVARAHTDRLPAPFAVPARRLGYQLVLDYEQEHRGLQGSTASGALLVDGSLACPRANTAHAAANPPSPSPTAERLRPPALDQLPMICQQPTVTAHPGSLGKIDKFRQDRHYLQPPWQDAYRPAQINIEGLNGRAKPHSANTTDPTRRLAHGRVASVTFPSDGYLK